MKTVLKKRYGQHFLKDTGTISRIAGLIQPGPDDLMIEIGAGTGAISAHLAPRVRRLLALEIDRDHIEALSEVLRPYPNAEVIRADILKTDLIKLVDRHMEPGLRLRVAGNLPYNIGTAIIEKIISEALPVHDMTFMLQFETAARITAAPGSKDYGYFSVYCRHYCDVKLGFKVSPACFVPRPRVQSAMLVLRPRPGVRDPTNEDAFLTVARAAFAYRRKTLANSLRREPDIGAKSDELLRKAGIDGTRRAEELSVEEYEHLSRVYRDWA